MTASADGSRWLLAGVARWVPWGPEALMDRPLIHVPLADQQVLFPRIRGWLRHGGYFLATVGADCWSGTENYLGAPMFWDHADTGTYLRWLQAAGLAPIWHRFIPEGNSGHALVLARAI